MICPVSNMSKSPTFNSLTFNCGSGQCRVSKYLTKLAGVLFLFSFTYSSILSIQWAYSFDAGFFLSTSIANVVRIWNLRLAKKGVNIVGEASAWLFEILPKKDDCANRPGRSWQSSIGKFPEFC